MLTPTLAHQLKLLLWEEDGSFAVNRRWYRRLVAYGFSLLWRVHDTFDPSQHWSRGAVHSAWGKHKAGGAAERKAEPWPSCEEYRRAHGLDRATELACTNAALTEGSILARQRGVHSAHFAQGARPGEFNHTCEYGGCPGYRGLRLAGGAWGGAGVGPRPPQSPAPLLRD